MAARLTSVMDNSVKVAEYILVCREMDIKILPPDINEGYAGFTASGERSIRYGMASVRGLGRPVIGTIVEERELGGNYRDLRDFIDRICGKDVNKRAIENLIKAGALDTLPGNRRQKLIAYTGLLDSALSEKKQGIAGQMSLFDLMGEGEISTGFALPDVEDFPEELRLSYEKEVLCVYISGHPLQAYEGIIKKNITKRSTDFMIDEEIGIANVEDGQTETIGGIISDIAVRQTKKGDTFASIIVEDLVGSVQVFVWPDSYRKYKELLALDQKVFVTGRVRTERSLNAALMLSARLPMRYAA